MLLKITLETRKAMEPEPKRLSSERIARLEVGPIREHRNGGVYFILKLLDKEGREIAGRAMWGKVLDDGSIRWSQLSPDKWKVSWKLKSSSIKQSIELYDITAMNYDELIPKGYWLPPVIIKFKAETISMAVKRSKRKKPVNERKTKTRKREEDEGQSWNSEVEDGSNWSEDELTFADWDYNPTNPAHNPDENPWIDVFGPGEEAETAYWNTD